MIQAIQWLPAKSPKWLHGGTMRHVYFIRSGQRPFVKIGIADDVWKRIWNLQSGNPDELKVLTYVETDDAPALERHLHGRFSQYNRRGEWFFLSDSLRECIESFTRTDGRPFRVLMGPQADEPDARRCLIPEGLSVEQMAAHVMAWAESTL